MLLEICAYNIQSCIRAASAGAGRIELCSDPVQGGVTPGFGIINYVQEVVSIPVSVMIRPRGGDFVYDSDEMEICRRDILQCREMGCSGVVVGAAQYDGSLDTDKMRRFAEWAYPMQVTCHKVFDGVPDASAGLELLIEAGYTRVLTSGLKRTAWEGAEILKALITQAGGRIAIMPGGGVRSSNIGAIARATGAGEFHSSAILNTADGYTAHEDEINNLLKELNKIHF